MADELLDGIAVVGIAIRFPGASTLDAFWANLCSGVESVTFFSDEELRAAGVPEAHLRDPSYVKAAAVLDGIEQFDAEFFGLSAHEADVLDPQHRLFLECAWESLENAGYASIGESRNIGVYAGTSVSTYLLYNLYHRLDRSGADLNLPTLVGNDKDYLATRVAYKLDLTGLAVSVQTTCSTSLVAVHLACQGLLNFDCDMALAGGVTVRVPHRVGYSSQGGRMLTPNGHCRVFDEDAAGTVPASGVGVVLLKRLEDAQADGDHIYAILLGSAVNNDGADKLGYTAPSIEGQAAVISAALAIADVDPATLQYIEAHGTGTPLGDPIEIAALKRVFGPCGSPRCAIGSVKSNFGHLESAAGVAGLIKTVLAIYHGKLPPSLHFQQPNPEIDFENGPFYVNSTLTDWPMETRPRRAGVSSFGFGGTNCHVIVEEAPRRVLLPAKENQTHLITLSARTEPALKELARRYADFLSQDPVPALADLAYTLHCGRAQFDYRLALLGSDHDSLANSLAAFADGTTNSHLWYNCIIPANESATSERPSPLLRSEESIDRRLLESLAQRFVEGLPIDWQKFHQNRPGRRVPLPTYPFQRKRHWVDPAPAVNQSPSQSVSEHPLLGVRVRSASKTVVYESTVSTMEPVFLDDHRIHGEATFPATGYLEMALTAGRRHFPDGSLALRNVAFEQPLFLSDRQDQVLQFLMNPSGSEAAEFEIHSLVHDCDPEKPQWRRHASGRIERADPPEDNDDVPPIYDESFGIFDPEEFWACARQNGMDYGPAFQVIRTLFRSRTESVSEVTLSEELVGEANRYELHPTVFDACLQTFGAIFIDRTGDGAFVAIGLDRLHVYGRLTSKIHCHARLRGEASREAAHTGLTGDIRVYDDQGDRIAEVVGLRTRHVSRAALGRKEQDFHEWLYEVHWKSIPEPSDSAKFLVDPHTVIQKLHRQVPDLLSEWNLEGYGNVLRQLDELGAVHVANAFDELGWNPRIGDRVDVDSLTRSLRIDPERRRLLARMLEILVEEKVLHDLGEGYEVSAPLPTGKSGVLANQFLDRFPSFLTEGTLLDRCGGRLADILAGKCDPLSLLFDQEHEVNADTLYRRSPSLQMMNSLVRSALEGMLEQLPADRPLRVLEIGAGTGGTTASALTALPKDRTRYTFTDVSAAFFVRARERFEDYPFLEYRVFDLQRDPMEQGLNLHGYDIVLASNVVHATRDLRKSLSHIQKLLAAGGMLVLVEGTERQRWVDLVFGLTEGWSQFEDCDLRPNHPLLPVPRWLKLLEEFEFEQPMAIPVSNGTAGSNGFSGWVQQALRDLRLALLIARGPAELPSTAANKLDLLFTDEKIGGKLADRLRADGRICLQISSGPQCERLGTHSYQLDPFDSEQIARLSKEVSDRHGLPVGTIIHLGGMNSRAFGSDPNVLRAEQKQVAGSTLALVQGMLRASLDQLPNLWMLTRGAFSVDGSETAIEPMQALVWGMGRVLANEHPQLPMRMLDLDPSFPADEMDQLARLIVDPGFPEERELALRSGKLHVRRLKSWNPDSESADELSPPADVEPQDFLRPNATYLITGGWGGIGLELTRYLVQWGARHLVLLGRSQPTEEVRSILESLREQGAVVETVVGDVTSAEDVERIIDEIQRGHYPLRGVFHLAAILEDGVLEQQSWSQFERVLAPKVQGAWNLHRRTTMIPLDHFVLFSSAVSLFGSPAQGNYAAANSFLDSLALLRRMCGLPVLSINWGGWGKTGKAAVLDAKDQRRWSLSGTKLIEIEEGMALLHRLLSLDEHSLLAMPIDWEKFLSQFSNNRCFVEDLVPLDRKTVVHEDASAKPRLLCDMLGQVPPLERGQTVFDHVRRHAARILGVDVSTIDQDRSLLDTGFDSLMAVELRNALAESVGQSLPSTLLFDHPTTSALKDFLCREVLGIVAEQTAEPQTELPDEEIEIREKIQQLSDPELRNLIASEFAQWNDE